LSDPVSWFVIEQGWEVVDADGNSVGKVEETVGDSSRDIFNGITVAMGALSKAKYVPAEQVGEITDGRIRLALRGDEIDQLGGYDEPPPSERIVAP
jgi:hypothetical protein